MLSLVREIRRSDDLGVFCTDPREEDVRLYATEGSAFPAPPLTR